MPLGHLCLVLHAHLPYVRHPEYDDFLEEDWLYEAITETYIPLLEVFENLERDGVDWRLTMSLSPTLAGMLSDPLLQFRYVRHLDNLMALANKELERTRWQPEFHELARMYLDRFTRARDMFVRRYDNNLLNGFRRFYEAGKLELITCGATHGYLPLMDINRNAMRAQIELGAREFERHFGRRPQGIWLPECAYTPGADELCAEAGIRYFFTDTHGVLFAHPRPKYGVYAPIRCPNSGVAVLGRDTESSKQVWSAIEGYPGDYNYRDFYRDIGFDLDFEYLRPHLHQTGIRHFTGIKYYKITGRTDHKEPYNRQAALDRAAEHAGNFMFNREKQVEWLSGSMDGRPALIVAPYDAELFGHWWFEGPDWIDFLLRKLCFDQETVKAITVPEYLDRYPNLQVCQPPMSSWGYKGYNEVWLEGSNDWIYRHLHEDAERMVALAHSNPDPSPLRRRALNQAARELLLAQSSDWAFIMKTGTMVDYATQRTNVHVLNFNHLYDQINSGHIDEPWLSELERRHNVFPNIDYRVYA
ncbi:MAG TPA: 1,4-alpha-glucan branching protein domain-containing protein [Gemmataceae bacterium]